MCGEPTDPEPSDLALTGSAIADEVAYDSQMAIAVRARARPDRNPRRGSHGDDRHRIPVRQGQPALLRLDDGGTTTPTTAACRELVRNRAFLDDAATPAHWAAVQADGSAATIALDPKEPLNATIRTSLRLDVTEAATGHAAGVYDVPREYRTWSRWIKRLNRARGSSEWSRP